ncbi:MAG TPA: FGGY family carbohydrate kinase, partial [Rhodoglobus sp.]|nr:FGGY family carbohydrate kinase [Rhodoglobus sp.]
MTTDTPKFVLSLDQGTTSTRAMIFDHAGAVVTVGQLEHRQHFPQAGWVEHDPVEIWDNTRE